MSSSTTNNQSAETNVASGMTFNIADIDIAAPKVNKSGGKSSNILYKPTKKGLYLNLEVPMLTWGASAFKDQASGKETFDMSIQFPRQDYSTPETDILLANFQSLEQHIKNEAVRNSMTWFNKKTMTPEVIEALWTPMLKYSKDSSGEPDMTKAPTLKVKMPCWEGKFNCEIYDPAGNMMYPLADSSVTPMDLIPKGVNIVAIIQCGGLWFANGKFGCTWRLFQAVVQPKPSMKGKCLISLSSSVKTALSNATTTREVGVIVEDDSESEGEEVSRQEVTRQEVISEEVIHPAVTTNESPSAQIKKKIVRKKNTD
jgi:hypothetical protein